MTAEEVRQYVREQWSEKEFQLALLTQILSIPGWVVIHLEGGYTGLKRKDGKPMFRTPYRGDDGFPDTVALNEARQFGIAWELKVKGKQATPGQLQWLRAFQAMGFHVGVYYPADWDVMMDWLAVPGEANANFG